MINRFIKYNLILALIIIINALSVIFQPLNQLYVHIIMPLLAVFIILKHTYIFRDKLLQWYTIFTISFIFISLFGENFHNTINALPLFINTYLVVLVTTTLSRNYRYINCYFMFYFLYLIACLYVGVNSVDNLDITSTRLDSTEMNANRYGYFLFFLVFVCYILGEISYNHKKLWRIIFLTSPIPVLFISLITASRQILLIMVPFIIILMIRRYFLKLNHTIIIKTFLVILLGILITPYVHNLYQTSYLNERMNENVLEDSRSGLIIDAIKIGLEKPITGVGLGNLDFLSHCSYSDIIAEGGIFVFIIYTGMLIFFCHMQLKRYRKTQNNIFIVFLIFGIFYMVYNLFFVFYL